MNTPAELFSSRATTVGIWGIGLTGQSLIGYLRAHYPHLSIVAYGTTVSNVQRDFLAQAAVPLYTGDDLAPFLATATILIPSPGIDLATQSDQERSRCLNELDLFATVWRGKIIAITGSIGKTSTVHLIHALLMRNGYTSVVGGNVGTPLFELVQHHNRADTYAVLELSSFQLDWLRMQLAPIDYPTSFQPDCAILTNLHPNHIDRHGSYEQYVQAKLTLFKRLKRDGIALVPRDTLPLFSTADFAKVEPFSCTAVPDLLYPCEQTGEICRQYPLPPASAPNTHKKPALACFSSNQPTPYETHNPDVTKTGYYQNTVSRGTAPQRTDSWDSGSRNTKSLQKKRTNGRETVDHETIGHETIGHETVIAQYDPTVSFPINWTIACGACSLLGISPVKTDTGTITLPAHRIDVTGEVNGITFYDDSKSTIMQSTLAALDKVGRKHTRTILLLGGLSKGVDRIPHIAKVGAPKVGTPPAGSPDTPPHAIYIICFGAECAALAAGCRAAGIAHGTAETFEQAVKIATDIAKPGDAVLLSPGGASFDLFTDYKARGDAFTTLVHRYAQKQKL